MTYDQIKEVIGVRRQRMALRGASTKEIDRTIEDFERLLKNWEE